MVTTRGAILHTPRITPSSHALKVFLGTGVATAAVALGSAAAPAQATPVGGGQAARSALTLQSAQTATSAATTQAVYTVAATTATSAASKSSKQKKRAAAAVRYAKKQIGDRYRYGGTGPHVWDCSGLAGGSWRKAGVKLPRTTTQIYRKVRTKVSYRKLRTGDLVFFYSGKGHMGIYVGKGYMIHAPSSGKRVKKVKLSGYYRSHFSGAVRPGL